MFERLLGFVGGTVLFALMWAGLWVVPFFDAGAWAWPRQLERACLDARAGGTGCVGRRCAREVAHLSGTVETIDSGGVVYLVSTPLTLLFPEPTAAYVVSVAGAPPVLLSGHTPTGDRLDGCVLRDGPKQWYPEIGHCSGLFGGTEYGKPIGPYPWVRWVMATSPS